MITVFAALSAALATTVAQAPPPSQELSALARHAPDSVLIERARLQPNVAYDAIRILLWAGGGDDSAANVALTGAERLASALAVAWQDSFPVRRVRRFRGLPTADRQATVATDRIAIRSMGGLTPGAGPGKRGIDSTARLQREILHRYEALADTAGVGYALARIGLVFREAQEYDSADTYLTRSLELAERIGHDRLVGSVVSWMGSLSFRRGQWGRMDEQYARSTQILERVGDLSSMAFMQADRGWVAEHVFGDYVTATARYRESLATYQRIGNLDGAASAVGFIASVQMKRGEYRAAEATLRTASGVGRRPVAAAAARLSASLMLVTMRRWMGDLDGARLELDRITAFADSLDRPQRQITLARIALARGDLALAFNRLDEAERGFEQARLIAGGVANERTRNELLAQAQVSTARVHYERGDFPRARLVLEDLLARNTSTPIDAAKLWLQLGGAAQRSGDTAAARRAFVQALDQLRTARAPLTEAAAFRRLGDLEAVAGYGVAAESLYRRALSHLGDSRADPELAFTVRAELARVLRSRGALDDAAGELYAAITEIERISGGLRREQDRSDYLSDKWEAYVELALVERQRGRVEDAFATSERLRARQLLDLLARGRPGERDAQRGLRNREQDLRRQIVELARQAGSGGERVTALRDPAPVEGAPDEVSEALVRARQAYGELLTEMNAVDPSYAAVVRGEVATARDVRQALAPDEALLEYLVGESTTVVFVITRDTLAALDLNLSHRSLAELVDFARTAIGSAPRGSSGLRAAWRAPMRRLYQQLLAPVEASGLLARKRRLRIAPHAELHYLPFAALLRPGPPEQQLIERYTIEHVPSASVWLRLRNRPAPGRGSGVLVLTPRGASLPGSQAEAAAIRRIYGTRARSLVGVAASEGAFRQLAPTQEIIHLATYGVLNKVNPLFSFVELGAGGEEDGRLEVHEVFGLTLNARLVVLSACQTGVAAGTLADVPPGDDWVGMVQAFLYAGSANVLATLWPIEDRATARLMERFYLALAEGRSEAEALALAQRAAARDATTAHPFYWAGFALVGGN